MGLPNIGPLELIIILAIALLIVGPGKLPEMGSAIGRTIREFRKASTDITDVASVDPQPGAPTQSQPNALAGQATPNSTAPTTAVAPETTAAAAATPVTPAAAAPEAEPAVTTPAAPEATTDETDTATQA